MAKRLKKKVVTKNSKEIEHLETLLKFSLGAVDGKYEQLDSIFSKQADKIRKEIKNLG